MAIRGFDSLASKMNDGELMLRKVIHMQARETLSGADLLSGENLTATCFEFNQCAIYFICLGETDEIEISKTAPNGHWVSSDVSHESPWSSVIGSELNNIWQLSNAKGYDDGVILQFGNNYGNIRVLLDSIASRFSVFGVIPNESQMVTHA